MNNNAEKVAIEQVAEELGAAKWEHMRGDLVALSMAQEIGGSFQNLLSQLKAAKPEERSEAARRYAVTITELEKCAAYFKIFVILSG